MRFRRKKTIWRARPQRAKARNVDPSARRLTVVRVGLVLAMALVVSRLFYIQVLSHGFYSALASDQHGIFSELFPERGQIWLTDPKSPDGQFPIAVNKTLTMVYADTRNLTAEETEAAAQALAEALSLDEATVLEKLSVPDDPYVPIQGKVDDDAVAGLRELDLAGIHFSPQTFRYYPEKQTACHLTGFVGSSEEGERVGRYGVEGHWDEALSGQQGFLASERDPAGRFITAGNHDFQPAQDGADIRLTVDRNIQFIACEKLRDAVGQFQATGGAVVILEPDSGRILAMCGSPSFDPNQYSQVSRMSDFNNPATYYAYEPGSVFKPLTMAAAIDVGAVTPKTGYNDTGSVEIGKYTIRNSDGQAHGWQTMTQVLEKSLNTGAIFAVRELGADRFRKYMEAFGFGELTGVEIDKELPGDISSLSRHGDIWSATASYGQGVTATPLQVAAAFGALANGGKLMRPYLIDEVSYPDGRREKTEPQEVRQVVSKRAADLVSGMLVRVVENGHGKRAGVPGYWVAGKTGTAQISDPNGDGYLKDDFIGTFVGFAPVDDPAFVMLAKVERPQGVSFAESTAAPLFGEIAGFLLQYLEIPPDRPVK